MSERLSPPVDYGQEGESGRRIGRTSDRGWGTLILRNEAHLHLNKVLGQGRRGRGADKAEGGTLITLTTQRALAWPLSGSSFAPRPSPAAQTSSCSAPLLLCAVLCPPPPSVRRGAPRAPALRCPLACCLLDYHYTRIDYMCACMHMCVWYIRNLH